MLISDCAFLRTRRQRLGDMPRQQGVDLVDRMLGDALEDMAQIGFGIEAVECSRADQAVDRGGTFAAASAPANR